MGPPVLVLFASSVFAVTLAIDSLGASGSSVIGDAKAGERKASLCLVCHRSGDDKPQAAHLEGQPAAYLHGQLKAFKEKRRPDYVMITNAASLSDRDMRDIAQYFASQPRKRESYKLDPRKVMEGKIKVQKMDCAACHGGKGSRSNIPDIAGQKPAYLLAQLEALSSGTRQHGAAPVLKLSREDAERLAHYFAEAE